MKRGQAILLVLMLPFAGAGMIFHEPFEDMGTIQANLGSSQGIEFKQGRIGNGAYMDSADFISYPAQGKINPAKGTLDFWFSPGFQPDDGKSYYLFSWFAGDTRFLIFKYGSTGPDYLVFRVDSNKTNWAEVSTSNSELDINSWQPGSWHHIIAFWDFTADKQFIGFVVDSSYRSLKTWNWSISESPAEFHVGTYNRSRYVANSVFDEFRIYDAPVYDPSVPLSYINLTRGDGICDPHETAATESVCPVLDQSIPGDLIFFNKPAFSAVYPGTIPRQSELGTLRARAAQGQREILFFNVHSRNGLEGTLQPSGFASSSGNIPAPDIRIVHNWWQAGKDVKKEGFPAYAPELLLHEESVDFSLAYTSKNLPSLPVLPYVRASLEPGTSRQFALLVDVPEDARPGTYFSTVTLTPKSGPAKQLGIELQVLPFMLPLHDRMVMLYHSSQLDPANINWVLLDHYKLQLNDIRKHGFNGIGLYETNNSGFISRLTTMYDEIRSRGFNATVLLGMNYNPDVANLMLSHGYPVLYYGIDEPNDMAKISQHIAKSIPIHAAGGKVLVAIKSIWAQKLKDCDDPIYDSFPAGTCEPLDIINMPAYHTDEWPRLDGLMAGTVQKEPKEIYYWQMAQEDPKVNRYHAGYLLWLTGMDGIMPYGYSVVRNNPYDDWDIWSANQEVYRDHLVVYPSQQGPVPTVQWEALAQGINDYRYLMLWKSYVGMLKQVDPAAAAGSETMMDQRLQRYRKYADYRSVPAEQFAFDREATIDEILRLRSLLSPHICSYDTDFDWSVGNGELLSFIALWRSGSRTLRELIGVIEDWKNGC